MGQIYVWCDCFSETSRTKKNTGRIFQMDSSWLRSLLNANIHKTLKLDQNWRSRKEWMMHRSHWFVSVTIFGSCCQGLKICLILREAGSVGFIMCGYSRSFGFGQIYFCAALYRRNRLSSPHRPCPSSARLTSAGHLFGLISSGKAEAVGHSISPLCMLSASVLPFFSKGSGNNFSCPPVRWKWVADHLLDHSASWTSVALMVIGSNYLPSRLPRKPPQRLDF